MRNGEKWIFHFWHLINILRKRRKWEIKWVHLHNSACSSRTQKTFNINYACGHKWLGFQFQSVTSIVARFYVLHAISLYDFGFEYFKKWNKTELLVIKKKIEEHFIINYVFHTYTYANPIYLNNRYVYLCTLLKVMDQ